MKDMLLIEAKGLDCSGASYICLLSTLTDQFPLLYHSHFTFGIDCNSSLPLGSRLRSYHGNIEKDIAQIFGITFSSINEVNPLFLQELIMQKGFLIAEMETCLCNWLPKLNIYDRHMFVIKSIKDQMVCIFDPIVFKDNLIKPLSEIKIIRVIYMDFYNKLQPDIYNVLSRALQSLNDYDIDLEFECFINVVSALNDLTGEFSAPIHKATWNSDLVSNLGYVISGSRWLYSTFLNLFISRNPDMESLSNAVRSLENEWTVLKNLFVRCILWNDFNKQKTIIISRIKNLYNKEKECSNRLKDKLWHLWNYYE